PFFCFKNVENKPFLVNLAQQQKENACNTKAFSQPSLREGIFLLATTLSHHLRHLLSLRTSTFATASVRVLALVVALWQNSHYGGKRKSPHRNKRKEKA
ncbi:hypothetical protein QP290_25910, partial [Escherichia coli]|nr:hypothetical protein [Escherichia coli]